MDFNTMLNQMKQAAQQQGIPLDMTRGEVNEGQDFLPENVQLQGRPMRIQVPVQMGSLMEKSLLAENNRLRREVEQLQNVVTNSKLDMAEMYSKFGELANDWSNVVKHLEEMQLQQKNNYEARIKSLEEKNEQLVKENEEMKKIIKDFEKVKLEFEKQKRQLKIGQVACKLEKLVSEYVFPGQDKASKRARYGTNLKSLKRKIDSLNDQNVQDHAKLRFPELDKALFEDWFIGVVKKMKCSRLDTAHPNIGTYEEMKAVISEEFSDPDECDDMLIALDHLREMYLKMQRPFGV
ncbi:uncharacterized protein LOC124433693 isoform X2 [Xenia sp. Carnegie-2017]|uniref:uncharacterized protein LOC124433693 isoform X2 n=1 Tax=Xenia sp. Carnegie-2017 TaxID=2897299 RepID=UPI001F04F748|nr:uncharacterized protein LOC124433693 isoform X2 [Xenia sp. Carnegie-2017]